MRLLWIALGLALILLIPFLIWGETFTTWFTGDAAVHWLRTCGPWGWIAVIGLLMSDLFLPLPATGIMAAAGFLYGAWVGGLLSATGSFLSGMLAYGLCWKYGRAAAVRMAGENDLQRGEVLFQQRGPWLVAISRAFPLLPEVVACLAGVTRMPFRIFTISLACGSIPLGFIYAAIGAAGQENPRLALLLSIVIPPALWALVRLAVRDTTKARRSTNPS